MAEHNSYIDRVITSYKLSFLKTMIGIATREG
jgi:hypothetical protein